MQIDPSAFDDLFDSVVDEPAATAGPDRSWGADEEARIQAAVNLFHRSDYGKCLAVLDGLETSGACADPRVAAFRAAAGSMLSGNLRPGVEACIRAIRQAFYLPDIYAALGVLLIRLGERSKAYAAFRRGLKIDSRHPALRARLAEMGMRRRPVLRFLSRGHPANRVLGLFRARLLAA